MVFVVLDYFIESFCLTVIYENLSILFGSIGMRSAISLAF